MGVHTIIGMDIGATKIAVGHVRGGRVSRRSTLPTRTTKGAKGVLDTINAALSESLKGVRSAKVGIGIAGATDAKKGIFLGGPNFPRSFRNVKLATLLERRFGAAVRIDNDARCFTLGEALHGAGKGSEIVVGMTLGTGIGGGLAIGGHLYHGAHDLAGEVGHMVVSMDSATECGCGMNGHLEAFASGGGIEREFFRRDGSRRTAKEIAELAGNGDAKATAVYDDARRALASGLANITHTFDPDVIAIGGGLSSEPLIWSGLTKAVTRLLVFPVSRKVRIVRSSLRENANILGAAALHTAGR